MHFLIFLGENLGGQQLEGAYEQRRPEVFPQQDHQGIQVGVARGYQKEHWPESIARIVIGSERPTPSLGK